MPVRAVQISIEPELLRRVDSDPETRRRGRSAFIRSAVTLYLRAKQRRRIDAAIQRAYRGRDAELLSEIEGLMEAQAWPDE